MFEPGYLVTKKLPTKLEDIQSPRRQKAYTDLTTSGKSGGLPSPHLHRTAEAPWLSDGPSYRMKNSGAFSPYTYGKTPVNVVTSNPCGEARPVAGRERALQGSKVRPTAKILGLIP
eukprot:gnl/MRDRNA2_/MRDRNA2_167745_c0_seq1.p1 gnl/MRDRNA2_/MRDRNA2_167745_c0~~gnl/MRDRNA2_/MRDRNA2_167745_c0_seq1.p1  ORF type:complete len:116 (-),score=13.35 gnl/MRDRNA2_/MRDRNA2_167745_c0_seq1:59-406(-)